MKNTNRIFELVDQAKWYTNSEGETYRTLFQFEERFAELIIRECGKVLESYDPDFDWATVELKKHFGIKDESKD